MLSRYVRDYYVNAAESREVSSVGFEEEVLKGGLLQIALRARGASPQFKMNPLYEETKDCLGEYPSPKVSKRSSRCESGYASSLDSLASCLPGERLAPPSTPEVVERTFLSLPRLRNEVTSSLRLRPRRPRPKFGGSLRLNKTQLNSNWWLWYDVVRQIAWHNINNLHKLLNSSSNNVNIFCANKTRRIVPSLIIYWNAIQVSFWFNIKY